jgi:hypothetical protein
MCTAATQRVFMVSSGHHGRWGNLCSFRPSLRRSRWAIPILEKKWPRSRLEEISDANGQSPGGCLLTCMTDAQVQPKFSTTKSQSGDMRLCSALGSSSGSHEKNARLQDMQRT